jgi:hypothetical protein
MRQYHGWLIYDQIKSGDLPSVWVEYRIDGKVERVYMDQKGERGCTEAVEWWDKKLETKVKLEPAFRGQYRVYTESEEVK